MRSSTTAPVVPVGTPRARAWLVLAVFVALLARLPAVWWGSGFPPGWYEHHPDEYTHVMFTQTLIQPNLPDTAVTEPGPPDPWSGKWTVHPYPRGLAAHVAVPVLAARVAQRQLASRPPRTREIVIPGRIVSVLYGTATVVLVFFLALRLFRDARVGLAAAWLTALGGLHVTQSHFFTADVPGTFWLLLGLLALWRDLEDPEGRSDGALQLSAFAMGVSFGLKITLVGLPSLFLVTIFPPSRVRRLLQVAVFFVAGAMIVNVASYSPWDLLGTLTGLSSGYKENPWASAMLYLVELPSIVSLPVLLAATAGTVVLLRRLLASGQRDLWKRAALVVVLPNALHLGLVAFSLNHFARHLVPLIPWMAIAAAWALVRLADHLAPRWSLAPRALAAVVGAWLALFVWDGERGFLNDPRNEAARWVQANLEPGKSLWWYYHRLATYAPASFRAGERPDLLVMELMDANHFLSGLSWRDSRPRDFHHVFDAESQQVLDQYQALFDGTYGYQEVARFRVPAFMPEYVWTDRLLGNRSRNYLTDVVIFRRTSGG